MSFYTENGRDMKQYCKTALCLLDIPVPYAMLDLVLDLWKVENDLILDTGGIEMSRVILPEQKQEKLTSDDLEKPTVRPYCIGFPRDCRDCKWNESNTQKPSSAPCDRV